MMRRIWVLVLSLGILHMLSGCAVDFSPSGPSVTEGYGRGADYGEPDGEAAERRNWERERAYRQWERRGERQVGGYGDLN